MNYTTSLSNEQIQRLAPSAFAANAHSGRSNRYSFIPTSCVIDGMRNAGFLPVTASQSRCRIEDKAPFTKHMIRFRPVNSLTQQAVVGNNVLEAVLINSHDGTSAYKLMCGIFRFVCSNGMVVADSLIESIHVRHTGKVIEEVVAGCERILEQAPVVTDTIKEWQAISLSQPEQKLLAEHAHSLRFPVDEETGEPRTKVTPELLLSARRREDSGSDLWTTFNRIQENAIRGVKTWGHVDGRVERISSRQVKGIDQDVKLNRALWSLAEKMAELKRAA